MKCPHCAIAIHEDWAVAPVSKKERTQLTPWRIRIMTCPECNGDILHYGKAGTLAGHAPSWTQFYPSSSNRGPVPPDVPTSISQDYEEAAKVLPHSAKASAALSRRCLQAVLLEAGYQQYNLANQIKAVLDETDPSKRLPTGVHDTLHTILNFGNFAAHPITDRTTLQIIDVEPAEAEHCLDILDEVFDHYYAKPAKARRLRAALDAKRAGAGKPPQK